MTPVEIPPEVPAAAATAASGPLRYAALPAPAELPTPGAAHIRALQLVQLSAEARMLKTRSSKRSEVLAKAKKAAGATFGQSWKDVNQLRKRPIRNTEVSS